MSTRKPKSTPAKSKTTMKPTASKPPTKQTPVKPMATSAAPSKAAPVVLGPVLRKKELIEKVVARSGIKKKDAKPVVEAMLAELGDALLDNREMALPPLGRVKINRSKALENGQVTIIKVRQKKANPTKILPAAE